MTAHEKIKNWLHNNEQISNANNGEWSRIAFEASLVKIQSDVIKILLESLQKTKSYLNNGVLQRWEYVRQLDGSLKQELIDTGDGLILKDIETSMDHAAEIIQQKRTQ